MATVLNYMQVSSRPDLLHFCSLYLTDDLLVDGEELSALLPHHDEPAQPVHHAWQPAVQFHL